MDELLASLNVDASVFDNASMLDLDSAFMDFDTQNPVQLPSASPPGSAQPFVDYLTAPGSPEFLKPGANENNSSNPNSSPPAPADPSTHDLMDDPSANPTAAQHPLPDDIDLTTIGNDLCGEQKPENDSRKASALPADAFAAMVAATISSNHGSNHNETLASFSSPPNLLSQQQSSAPGKADFNLTSQARNAALGTIEPTGQLDTAALTLNSTEKTDAQAQMQHKRELNDMSRNQTTQNSASGGAPARHSPELRLKRQNHDTSEDTKTEQDSIKRTKVDNTAASASQSFPRNQMHASPSSNGGIDSLHRDVQLSVQQDRVGDEKHSGRFAPADPSQELQNIEAKLNSDTITNDQFPADLFSTSQPCSPAFLQVTESQLPLSEGGMQDAEIMDSSSAPQTQAIDKSERAASTPDPKNELASMDGVSSPTCSKPISELKDSSNDVDIHPASHAKTSPINDVSKSGLQLETGTTGSSAESPIAGLEKSMSDTKAEANTERAKLDSKQVEEKARSLVSTAWRSSLSPFAFVASARAELSLAAGDAMQWQLEPEMEAALLEALLSRISAGLAASTRLIGYLRHSLIAGLFSQRAVLRACVSAFPNMTDRVSHAISSLLAEMLPYFTFSDSPSRLDADADQYLNGLLLILKCAKSSTSLAATATSFLLCDRVITTTRTCVRRHPSKWESIQRGLSELESSEVLQSNANCQQMSGSTRSTSMLCSLHTGIKRLRQGLCAGAESLQSICCSMKGVEIAEVGCQINVALESALAVIGRVFGPDVFKAFRLLWVQHEPPGGDVQLLTFIEQRSVPSSAVDSFTRYTVKDKVRICQAIVRYLATCAAVPGSVDNWRQKWGGIHRLSRMLRDSLPQIKLSVRSEFSSLMVATAVVVSAAICLGPALQLDDSNIGSDSECLDNLAKRMVHDDTVGSAMMELSGFAMGSLEEAAVADEPPPWRSFGVWILLLASHCGCMLRAGFCDPVRVSSILQAWGGSASIASSSHPLQGYSGGLSYSSQVGRVPNVQNLSGSSANVGGSQSAKAAAGSVGAPQALNAPGNSTSASSGGTQNVHMGGHGSGHHPSSSSPALASSEGVAAFAALTTYAVIDASDTCGDDRTLRVFNSDLMR